MTEAKRGRDARNGKFIAVADARRRKATAIVESVKSKKKPRRKNPK